MPTSNYTFGGYTAGTAKGTGVKCEGGTAKTNDGWIVISNSNGVVRITTVGNPECFKVPLSNSNNSGVQNYLNSEASRNFTNGNFAQSVTNMDVNTAQSIGSYKNTGGYYFLSGGANSNNAVPGISISGEFKYYSGRTYGIRPVVTLKSNVYTLGQSNGAYVLTNSSTRELESDRLKQSFTDKVLEIIQSINF